MVEGEFSSDPLTMPASGRADGIVFDHAYRLPLTRRLHGALPNKILTNRVTLPDQAVPKLDIYDSGYSVGSRHSQAVHLSILRMSL